MLGTDVMFQADELKSNTIKKAFRYDLSEWIVLYLLCYGLHDRVSHTFSAKELYRSAIKSWFWYFQITCLMGIIGGEIIAF